MPKHEKEKFEMKKIVIFWQWEKSFLVCQNKYFFVVITNMVIYWDRLMFMSWEVVFRLALCWKTSLVPYNYAKRPFKKDFLTLRGRFSMPYILLRLHQRLSYSKHLQQLHFSLINSLSFPTNSKKSHRIATNSQAWHWPFN